MQKAAILAAGKGIRVKSLYPFKPIVKINGTPLIELTLLNLDFKNYNDITIIFNDDQKKMDLTLLPSLEKLNIHYFFQSTISSMHSLYEVIKRVNLKKGEHLFVSMVDSIVTPYDAKNFQEFCKTLTNDESGILVTSFIEDENPLTLRLDNEGNVLEFQCPNDEQALITSGVYYFSENITPVLEKMIESGQMKMRNFLSELVNKKYKIKAFTVKKTLDVDRPDDIISAELFLKEYK